MSVARQYKLQEFKANPITPRENPEPMLALLAESKEKLMNRTTDFTFLYQSQDRALRFTNTFKSSVIPGQERNLSTTPLDRKLKVYIQDQLNWTKEKTKEDRIESLRERAKSAAPIKVGSTSTPQKSRSFVDLMNAGDQKQRAIPTYISSVLPLEGNSINPQPIIKSKRASVEPSDKWKVDKQDIIPEKVEVPKTSKNNDLWKNYMGIKDTPLQRYLKEHHAGSKQEIQSTASNAKRQKGNVASNVDFNQHASNKDVYTNMNATNRKANEFDS